MESDDRKRISRHMFALISSGFYHQVREMVDRYGLSFVPEWSDGYALLYHALFHRNIGIAKMLLNKGAEVNALYDVSSPLVLAVQLGDADTIKMLLNRGANVNMEVVEGTMKEPLFHRALESFDVLHRDVRLIELFLQRGADLNAVDSFGQTALFHALNQRSKELVELFLTQGAKANVHSNSQLSPIHIAVRKCRKDVVELLLDEGAAVDSRAGDLATPLLLACDRTDLGSIGIVDLLVSRGADVHLSNEDGIGAIHAAAASKTRVLQLLLSRGADINAESNDGRTPLHCAIALGNKASVEWLLNKGAKVNAKTRNLYTPLHCAVLQKETCFAEMLLAKGADINAQTKDGKSCFLMAVEKSTSDIIDFLLKYEPDRSINQNCVAQAVRRCENSCHAVQTERGSILEKLLDYGFTLKPQDVSKPERIFFPSVINGSVKTVEALLKFSSDVPALLSSKRQKLMPLHLAAQARQLEMARLLLNYGADVNAESVNGERAIFFAIWNSDLRMFELLVSHKADVKYKRELLIFAVQSRIEIVEYLLQKDAYVNVRYRDRVTPLHMVTGGEYPFEYGHEGLNSKIIVSEDAIKIAKLLLRRGARVNAVDSRGNTPLMQAVRYGNTKLVELLLDYGADVNAMRKETQWTALEQSVSEQDYGVTQLLLARGARIHFRGNRPLHESAKRGSLEFVKLLVEYGADVNELSIDGLEADGHQKGSALHAAACAGHSSIVEYLLECTETNINMCTSGRYGWNAMKFAYEHMDSWPEMYQVLVKHIIKAKAAKLYVDGTNLTSAIPRNSQHHLQSAILDFCHPLEVGGHSLTRAEFAALCEAEVAAMKSEKISNTSLSLYNILTASTNQLVSLSRNADLKNALSSDDFSTKFPIYASWIIGRFSIGERRRPWFEQGIDALSRILPSFPCECIQYALDYLPTEDIRMLVLASQTEDKYAAYRRPRCSWYRITRRSWTRSLRPKIASRIPTKRKNKVSVVKPSKKTKT